MIFIIGDPRLQRTGGDTPNGAAAVDKSAIGPADLRDMSMRRDALATWQQETQFVIQSGLKMVTEFRDFHDSDWLG
jgi:hypothetical protein